MCAAKEEKEHILLTDPQAILPAFLEDNECFLLATLPDTLPRTLQGWRQAAAAGAAAQGQPEEVVEEDGEDEEGVTRGQLEFKTMKTYCG